VLLYQTLIYPWSEVVETRGLHANLRSNRRMWHVYGPPVAQCWSSSMRAKMPTLCMRRCASLGDRPTRLPVFSPLQKKLTDAHKRIANLEQKSQLLGQEVRPSTANHNVMYS
jgi:hypothetical protein